MINAQSIRPTSRLTLVRSLRADRRVYSSRRGVAVHRCRPQSGRLAVGIYGAAVVAASFLLAWAAEAAQIDVSGGLAIAVLALIAVLPEYAVDLYYAYVAGHDAEYTQYAAANMTGSNRLLMGLGWPVVVLVSLCVARKTTGARDVGTAGAGARQPGRDSASC